MGGSVEQRSRLQRYRDAARDGAKRGKQIGDKYGKYAEAAGTKVGEVGVAVLKTKTGRAAAKGAVGGAAVGWVLPFVSAVGGAVLAAGAVIVWRTLREKP